MGMDINSKHCFIGKWISSSACYYWLLILSILSCTNEYRPIDSYRFYFSMEQAMLEHKIRYFESDNGKIFPFTDYTDPHGKHFASKRYKDMVYVGYTRNVLKIISNPNKEKIVWPTKSRKATE